MRSIILGVAASALIAAAAVSQTNPTGQTSPSTQPGAAPTQPSSTPRPGATTTRPLPKLPPRPRLGQVDWTQVVSDRRQRPGERLLAAFKTKLDQGAVDRTRIPILIPEDGPLMERARFYSFGDFYSLNLDVPNGSVELTGTKIFTPAPKNFINRLKPEGPENLTVVRTIDGVQASFTRYGLLYTVEIRCDEPKDGRCREEGPLRKILEKVRGVVLGREARRAAGLEGQS